MLAGILNDVRYAARSLRKAPTYSVLAVLTLALGIGATVSMFSVVNGVLLRPLPYADSEQMVRIGFIAPRALCEQFWGGVDCDRLIGSSAPMLNAWRQRTTRFDGMAGSRRGSIVLLGDGSPQRLSVEAVSEDYFPVFRVQPARGRLFDPNEYSEGADLAVVSFALWRDLLGQDPDILERRLEGVGRTLRIVGVLPEGFEPPGRAQIFTPLDVHSPDMSDWMARGLSIVGRVADDSSIESADAELGAVAAALAREVPDLVFEGDAGSASARSMRGEIVGSVTTPLYLFLAAVASLLLIACTNVANLTLARGTARLREVAVRSALGAGRGRILRQVLAENLLLGIGGGALGVATALVATRVLARSIAVPLPRLATIEVDQPVLAFAVAASVLAGLVSGLLPALRMARSEISDSLRGTAGRMSEGAGVTRLRSSLVVAQIAIALVLLMGAGLLFNSFLRLRRIDTGFDPANAAALFVPFPANVESPDLLRAFVGEVLDNARAIPGVEEAALAVDLPLDGISWRARVATTAGASDDAQISVNGHIVGPGYFETLRIDLLAGRTLDDRDTRPEATGIVVSKALADLMWPDTNPVGSRLYTLGITDEPETMEVVGVVADVHQDGLRVPAEMSIYLPYQRIEPLHIFSALNLLVRYNDTLETLAGPLRAAVWDVDDRIPLPRLGTLQTRVDGELASDRVAASLLGVFAALALLLAVAGVYGTMAYAVGQRRREVGIRMALGAAQADVRRLVLNQGGRTTAIGLAIGLVGALALSRVLESSVYEVSTTDPMTLFAMSAVLVAASLLACWFPARRASRVDPARVLRAET